MKRFNTSNSRKGTRMKFIGTLALSMVIMQLFFSIASIQAYWGYDESDDCLSGHGIGHVYGTYIENPNILIDGKNNDTCWNRDDVYEAIIPMANHYEEATNFFVSYMYFKVIYDATNIYILATWNDTTQDIHDMGLICWDMNCTNYSVQMLVDEDAMETANPGERVDSWRWINNNRLNETTNTLLDDCFCDQGWVDANDERQAFYGYTVGDLRSDGQRYYQLEIVRTLTTSEPALDVQFEEEKPIRFSTSVCDGLENQQHAVSWTLDLNLTKNPQPADIKIPEPEVEEDNIPGYPCEMILSIAGLFIFTILRKNNKLSKKNASK